MANEQKVNVVVGRFVDNVNCVDLTDLSILEVKKLEVK